MYDFIEASLENIIPLPVQNMIGINNIRGDILSRVIKQAFDNCPEERTINKNSYQGNDGAYYIYKLDKIVEVTSNPHIDGLTYVIPREEFIKFNKPIPNDTEIIVKFYKKFEETSDSFRYYNRQYYNKPIINYLVTFFSDYLNDTPQDKITEATLITYINNYKKGVNKTNGKN